VQLGIDPIWFVVQGMTGHDIFTITRMTLPFFLLLLVAIVLLALFSGIATWLVDLKYN
jgi:TRAP-type C4-dicarboxylate transport system permease large subunit